MPLLAVKELHRPERGMMENLVTYAALPHGRDFARFDPFLVLNQHGPQVFPPRNAGLPFGPHPHRGIETLTFILEGDLTHRDSTGSESVIRAGGVQWMTAGRGIEHEEVSSEAFKRAGGALDVIQVWFNLRAAHKLTQPGYVGLQKDAIPAVAGPDGKTVLHPISGTWAGTKGPVDPVSGVSVAACDLEAGGRAAFSAPTGNTVLFYVAAGTVQVNGREAKAHTLVEFARDGGEVEAEALEKSALILGHGIPTGEPIVAYGPFVMNSEEEIRQAYADYRAGKFGG